MFLHKLVKFFGTKKMSHYEFLFNEVSKYPLITSGNPLCHVVGFANLGVAVTNLEDSIFFYNKIGFNVKEGI